MIRKYLSDIAIVSVFTLFAFWPLINRIPAIKDTDVPSSTTRKYEEGEAEPSTPAGMPGSYKNIAARNIFALDGSYGAGYYDPYNQQTSSGGGGVGVGLPAVLLAYFAAARTWPSLDTRTVQSFR